MSELEKKFYNWLMLNYCVPIKPEKIAKDFAEIAAKHYVNCDKCLELCNENVELKKKLAITKEKIIKVLEKHSHQSIIYDNEKYVMDKDFKQIATKILEDNK